MSQSNRLYNTLICTPYILIIILCYLGIDSDVKTKDIEYMKLIRWFWKMVRFVYMHYSLMGKMRLPFHTDSNL
jgi:hypothetical protein